MVFNETGRRASARVFGLGALVLIALALAGAACEQLGRFRTNYLLIPGLLFAVVPAGHALALGFDRFRAWVGSPLPPLAVCAAVLGGIYFLFPAPIQEWAWQLREPTPLEVGFSEARSGLLEILRVHTTSEARILWEDQRGGRTTSRWSALLPLFTERVFVGGLDADAGIEHAAAGLVDHVLAGRPLAECLDCDLESYSRRYNVGWVVCWSPEARERFARWGEAELVAELPGAAGGEGWLFRLKRKRSYALAGSATLVSADARHILLSDAVPAADGDGGEGQILLSLHHQTGMQVTPARVRLEKAVTPEDAIPFVRLRVSEPVGRVMITWPGR
jgi:hypothetical protein